MSPQFLTRASLAAVLLAAGLMLTRSTVSAVTVPQGFVDETMISGLNVPIGFVFLGDGRVLIAEKSGVVRLVKNGALQPAPFIDIHTQVNDYWDRGLLGITADPNFANNGFVYLYFVYENNAADYSGPKTSRLIRVTASGDVASPSSAVVILGSSVGAGCGSFPAGADCIPANSPSHEGGSLKFAADGNLFLSTGDGASFQVVDDLALRAQNLDSLAGKILRITSTGAGLSDNPFWNGNASSPRSKVWAYGLRNPFRSSFNPTTGQLFVGDVGWDAYEEIDVAVRGANLGWPCYEGPSQQPGYSGKQVCQTLYASGTAPRMPLVWWSHDGVGAAALGGTFYTGTIFPAEYQGAYFFGDYARGYFSYLKVDPADNLVATPVAFADDIEGPVDLQEGSDGNLYYLAINSNQLRRIRFTSSTSSPYISSRSWTSATNGWGPVERDMSNGEQVGGDGRALTLNGQTYSGGLGVHATSDVRYSLSGLCTTFDSDVGVDDEVGSNGSVVFQVWADGTKLYDSGVMTGTTATRHAQVTLNGRQELSLQVTDAGDGNAFDHGDWAGATLTCGSSPQPASIISMVSARDITTTSASVVWTTDVPADSQVEYGPTTEYGSLTSLQAAMTTSHTVPLAGLAPATVYRYRVHSRNASGVATVSGEFTFQTLSSSPTPRHLSDLTWTAATNGWGPAERDLSNGETGAADGRAITLNGVAYTKGLGVHALSDVRYALPADCTTFVADVGVDDEVATAGSVVFQVWVDGSKVLETPVLTGASATVPINVAVMGTELRLVVTDGGNGNASDHADWAGARLLCSAATNGTPPVPTISSPSPDVKYKVGDVITFSGSATDQEDGTLPGQALSWSIVIRHCPGGVCHNHPLLSVSGASGSFTVPDHGDDSFFDITLRATDSTGRTADATATLFPLTVPVTLTTSPTGLTIVRGGVSSLAPITFAGVVGSTQTIATPSPQNGLTFTEWSDGGAQSHNIVIGTSAMSFTATFADRTGPQISAVSAASTGTSVTIKWTTSEPADGQVQYGRTTAYGSTTPRVTALTTAHSIVITGLTAQTTYNYRMLSRDAAGNLTTSGNFTFKTKR